MKETKNTVQSRQELEDYALSIILPLLNDREPVWFPDKPIQGKPHWTSFFNTFLEGFCRPLWILPFILNNRKAIKVYYKNKTIRIEEWYKRGLLAGTDPSRSSYWGEYSVYGQVSTEIAPLSLALVFGKKYFWDILNKKEQKQVAAWLYKISALTPIKTHRNNHYWFPIFNNLALKRLGLKYHKNIIMSNLRKLDQFHMGKGWFYDGTPGRFDYYIPWSHHIYPMLWILLEDENEKYYREWKDKYIERTNEFLKYFPYFFDTTGLYVPFGRSLAYRFAAVGIFPLSVLNGCQIDPGMARRITLANINYFIKNGAPPGRPVPPGFTYPTHQAVERYISVSSSYWCVKGFYGLIMKDDHPFWKAPLKKIPLEKNDFSYKMDVPDVHLLIQGEKERGVSLFNNSCYVKIGGFGSTNEFYSKFVYNSRMGFGTSTRDLVSSDNMISLMTADKQITSHRGVFQDLGERDNVYYSKHVPFSNDKKTIIKTALLPLSEGFHVRAHKIKLSQDYTIIEGGFSCGKNIDEDSSFQGPNWICLASEAGLSFLWSYTPDNLEFVPGRIQPEAHILYPMAGYPSYKSIQPFHKGEYTLISCFYFESDRKLNIQKIKNIKKKLPVLKFKNQKVNKILFEFKEKKYIIKWDK